MTPPSFAANGAPLLERQLTLRLRVGSRQSVRGGVSLCQYSEHFDFPGRLAITRRPGQFQYRYGVKVQPKDKSW